MSLALLISCPGRRPLHLAARRPPDRAAAHDRHFVHVEPEQIADLPADLTGEHVGRHRPARLDDDHHAIRLAALAGAERDDAARFEETDWPQILAFYQMLERLSNNPIVSLNRIVATAMVEGPKAGLDALDVLAADARLKGQYRLGAVRAHLLEKAGDREAAVAHYRKAAARTSSVPERNYLVTRAARLA